MKPAWEKSIWISILRSERARPVEFLITMGATGYQLVMRLGNERVVLAAGGVGGVFGERQAGELIAVLTEGILKLKELHP